MLTNRMEISMPNERYDECCSACAPPKACPTGFSKVLDFKNVGLIIYRRLGKSKNVDSSLEGRKMGALKTVIIHNTSETEITSEEFVREMQKKEITCLRCRQIIELALKLLQKVPAINKKTLLGICDHCKLKDPCRDCKETTNSFISRYKAKHKRRELKEINENQMTKSNKMNAGKVPLQDEKTVKQNITETARHIKELLLREYAKAERELEISDLCSQTRRSTKSLPVIGIGKKRLQSDQPSPASDSRITAQKYEKNSCRPDDLHLSDFNDNLGKSTYPSSSARDEKRLEVLRSSKKSEGTKSIRTDDTDFFQIKKKYVDDYIFPRYLRPYAHEREKDFKRYDQYLGTIRKKYPEESDRKQSVETIISERKTELQEIHPILKKSLKKSDRKELETIKKSERKELETTEKDFTFSFPLEKKITDQEFLRHKTSVELITELEDVLRDKSEELKRKMIEQRLQEEEKRESKRLKEAEQARLIADRESNAERMRKASEEVKAMKKLELEKAIVKSKQLEQNKQKIAFKPQAQSTKQAKSQAQSSTIKQTSDPDRETPVSQLELEKTEPAGTQIEKVFEVQRKFIKKCKSLENKEIKESGKKQYSSKNENEKAVMKKEKEIAQLKEEKTLLSKQKEKKIKKLISDKKETENMSTKFSTRKKGTQTPKETQENDLADMIRGKNKFKPKDTSELARLQRFTNNKTADTTSTDKQPKTKKDTTKFDIQLKSIRLNSKIKDEQVLVKLTKDSDGPKYTCKDNTLPLHCDLELNVDLRILTNPTTECIQGQEIVNINTIHDHDMSDKQKQPLLFATHYKIPFLDIGDNETKKLIHEKPKTVDQGQNTTSGAIRYALSDRTFIEKGWTVLPTEKVMRKMNVYRMHPANPEFDWFKRNKEKQQMFYDSGELFAENVDDGRCRWYYRNQRLALDYYDAEELNAQQRFVLYSNGESDESGRARPYTVLAMFDYLGNAVVFDHGGKIRLKYNQTEGVVLDRSIGPVSHWKWHSLNDPPELQQVMIDTQMTHKDPTLFAMSNDSKNKFVPASNNEEMLAIEFDNVVKEKSKKLKQNFKPFQIRMKALQINEHFSLKVLDQANVYLIYRDGTTHIKLNIGMLLDHKDIVDTDAVEVGEVASNMERLPARSDSLAAMQKSVAYAQHFQKTRTERERRLRLPEASASADKLTAAVSRPVRLPLHALNSTTAISATHSTSCPTKRRLSSYNVY